MSKRPGVLVLAVLLLTIPVECKRRGSTGATGTAGTGAGAAGAASGGSGTTGGTSGQGGLGTGGSGGVGGAASGTWSSISGVAPCVLEVADVPQTGFVPWSWTACGPGCSTTGTRVLPTDDTVYNQMASAGIYGDEVHVRVSTAWGGHYYMNAVRRLSDGAVLAAVRAPGATTSETICSPLGFAPSAPHVLGFQRADAPGSGAGGPGTTVVAFLKSSGLAWAPPVVNLSTVQTSVFENDLGWGLALYDASLRFMSPPDRGPLSIIDQAQYPAYSAVGRGSLVISNPVVPAGTDEILRVWEPIKASRTVVAQADTAVRSVALSDAMVAWVGVHGPERRDGTYTAAEMYWSSPPAGKDTVSIMGGVALAGTHGFKEIQTWGDYAVTTGYPDGAQHASLFVVRFSDRRAWVVPARAGADIVRLLAISPTEIVTGENADTGDPALSWQMQYLTRYDLTRLDDLAAAR